MVRDPYRTSERRRDDHHSDREAEQRTAPEDEDEGSYGTNTPLGDQERDEILAFLERGLSSSQIARRLEIPVMRVAAIKAHRTMGAYGRDPAGCGP